MLLPRREPACFYDGLEPARRGYRRPGAATRHVDPCTSVAKITFGGGAVVRRCSGVVALTKLLRRTWQGTVLWNTSSLATHHRMGARLSP
jgi:hypothetical protein